MTPKVKAKAKQPPKKRSQSPVKRPGVVMVPQAHGGSLRHGSEPGNTPGTGRPPSIIRERLRGSFEDRINVLESIADGAPIEHAEIALSSVLGYLICPKCNEPLVPKPEHIADAFIITVEAKRSARAGDRTKSLDIMAKYGLGEKTETEIINHPEFSRQALAYQTCVKEAITEALAPPAATRLLADIAKRIDALTGGRRDG